MSSPFVNRLHSALLAVSGDEDLIADSIWLSPFGPSGHLQSILTQLQKERPVETSRLSWDTPDGGTISIDLYDPSNVCRTRHHSP